MSDSPYRPPQAESYQSPFSTAPNRDKLQRVAKYQRWVIFALLANIVVNILAFGTMTQSLPVRLGVLVISLVVVVFAITSIVLLAKEVINIGVAILCGILMFVPCVSLIVLLVVNQKATSYLQQHGIKVGFLGVDPNSI
jgi:Mn2+/Fe2+ NRAMP family transporter